MPESHDDTMREEGVRRGTDSQTVLEEIVAEGVKALRAKHRRSRKKTGSAKN